MTKTEISLKRVSCNENTSPKKKIRSHKVNFQGRLKSVIGHVASASDPLCTSSRELLGPEKSDFIKCNRGVLSQEFELKDPRRRRDVPCQEGATAQSKMSDDDKISATRKKLLAFMTLSRFLKNVWRKGKEMSGTRDRKSSIAQINNLKIQVASLKSLLTSDEKIMVCSMKEINSLKVLLSLVQDKYSKLKAEKEQVQKRSENLSEELSNILTEYRNERNTFILARSEAMALEAQLEKEREKIGQLRKENKSLLSKVERGLATTSSSNDTK